MKNRCNERGSTLILAMFLLLVFLGLTISMTMDARAQATMTGAVKLQQFYQTAGFSVLNRARVMLADYFVEPEELQSKADYAFGQLLALGGPLPYEISPDGYGILFDAGNIPMNAGMLSLTYEVWVNNNPDDPAWMMDGMLVDLATGATVDTNWDIDGKVVLTAIIYGSLGNDFPVAVKSSIVSKIGAEYVIRHGESGRQGHDRDSSGAGEGDAGSASSVSIRPLDAGAPPPPGP